MYGLFCLPVNKHSISFTVPNCISSRKCIYFFSPYISTRHQNVISVFRTIAPIQHPAQICQYKVAFYGLFRLQTNGISTNTRVSQQNIHFPLYIYPFDDVMKMYRQSSYIVHFYSCKITLSSVCLYLYVHNISH